MTASDMTGEPVGTSRRSLLKGAVGAGIGLAAWSAPKIGSVPAYALTNSTGVFNGVCYYIAWEAGGGQRWARGPAVVGLGKDTGRADSIVLGPGFTARFTWNNVFGAGRDLIIMTSGSPQPHDAARVDGAGSQHNQRNHVTTPDTPYANSVGLITEPATITITTPGTPCIFEEPGAGVTYTAPPTAGAANTAACVSGLTVPTGWETGVGEVANATVNLGPTSGTVTNVRDGSGPNYIVFNINCS